MKLHKIITNEARNMGLEPLPFWDLMTCMHYIYCELSVYNELNYRKTNVKYTAKLKYM
jgi:hypothetical protein